MSIQPIKTIFIGTPDFSVPGLKALIQSPDFDVVGVITQPDKKVGRKQIMTPPPVKAEAIKHNIGVYQPEKILEIGNCLPAELEGKSEIDLIVLIAYSQILPAKILNAPKYGAINVHASLLPKYRGSSCIQYPIMNGDQETGLTIMKMDRGLDTGPIIKQFKLNIENNDTSASLSNKLAMLSADILPHTLLEYISRKLKPKPQARQGISFAKELKKQDGKIDWSKPAEKIERFIRAMTPWPSAYAQLKTEKLKIKNIKILEVKNRPLNINKYAIGKIFVQDEKLAVQCKQGALVIKKIQLEGKKPVSGEEFINGGKKFIGSILK